MEEREKIYFNKKEAADYLGMTVRQLAYRAELGTLKPTKLGRTDVYTKRQLDDFRANGRSDIVETLFGTAEAVKYTGLLTDYLKTLVGNGEKHLVGHTWVYEKDELDAAIEEAAQASQPAEPPASIGARVSKQVRSAARQKAGELGRPMTDVTEVLLTKWLEGKAGHQERSSGKGNVYFHVHIPQSLYEQLRQKADTDGVTLAAVAAGLIERWVAGRLKI